MSRRVTVNLPDDVADRLNLEPNASAYVTTAVRERMEREDTRRLLADHGFPPVTGDGLTRARERRQAAIGRLTPQRRAELRRLGRTSTE
jgi:hypothetical protein